MRIPVTITKNAKAFFCAVFPCMGRLIGSYKLRQHLGKSHNLKIFPNLDIFPHFDKSPNLEICCAKHFETCQRNFTVDHNEYHRIKAVWLKNPDRTESNSIDVSQGRFWLITTLNTHFYTKLPFLKYCM